MGLPDITKEGQMVSALQDIASALEHIAQGVDTYNKYRYMIDTERDLGKDSPDTSPD